MKTTRFAFYLVLLTAAVHSAVAWNSAGHMTIASLAYRELSADQKKAVANLLAHHPAFDTWARIYRESSEDLDFGEFLTMKASTWPDEIRRRGGDTAQFDHPNWHFIDYPLRPASFPEAPGPTPDDDVLFGIQQCRDGLSDPSTDPELQAVLLSWAIHLVGDLHQPLHCASLFTDDFPSGDKGGNSFWVKPGSRGVKLHSLWDGFLGSSTNPRTAHNTGSVLKREHSRSSVADAVGEVDPVAWSKDGRRVAIESAYLHGDLRGSKDSHSAPALPNDYLRNSQKVAHKQAAIAAYRLAGFIAADVEVHTAEE